MRGTKLLIACFAMLVATAGQVQAGIIVDFEDIGVAAGSNSIFDGASANKSSQGFNFTIASAHSHLVNNRFSSRNNSTWYGFDRDDER